ncbi:alcohol dehydrogenase catalytic domain-containing protein [Okibacterium endophyticum]
MPQTMKTERPHEVLLKPPPFAMVWPGAGERHAQIAVPGVSLGDGDLLVEVELAVIGGCELQMVRGEQSSTPPLVLGHEQVGRVVAVGGEAVAVDGTRLVVGMRVVWSISVSCGVCDRCVRGLTQKCRSLAVYGHDRVHRGWELSGGFASHVQVLAGTAVVLVDEVIPATVAALAPGAVATAVAAIEAAVSAVELDGTTVVIMGAGALGLAATALATDAGATVIVVDPHTRRRDMAFEFGAAAVADPSVRAGAPTGIQSALRTVMASGAGECLVAMDMAGTPDAVHTLLSLADVGGVVILAGSLSAGGIVTIDPQQIVTRHLQVRGVQDYTAEQLARAVRYLARAWHRYPFAALVGTTLALDRADDALELAATGEHLRVGLSPRV